MVEARNKGIGYLRERYEELREHIAESVWQTCMCGSCQDHRELRHHEKGTSFRNPGERY
jgi:hypothetical protein